jgi:hypothetical protein
VRTIQRAMATLACAALASAALAAGCSQASPSASAAASVAGTQAPSVSVEQPCDTDRTLGPDGTFPLEAGTYAWVRPRTGIEFPTICLTVPDGWVSDGRFTYGPREGENIPPVAVQFWDVGQVYRHPCKWLGTLFDPGPTVDDLADALLDVPLRGASEPRPVTLDGYEGRYLEWSVPPDMETNAQGEFLTCDVEPSDGVHYFESWTGDPAGWGGDRYHQGPGQLDRLWILDVDGVRFVIDAFSMPEATEEEIDELMEIVSSITFDS